MIQIEVYRFNSLFANIPVTGDKGLCQVPIKIPPECVQMIAKFARGESKLKKFGGFSWNWKHTSG